MTPNKVKPLYLIINNASERIEEINWKKYSTPVSTDKTKGTLKSMKKYGANIKILLDQQIKTYLIMMKTIWKSNLTEMMIYFWEKHYNFMVK